MISTGMPNETSTTSCGNAVNAVKKQRASSVSEMRMIINS